MLKAVIFDLDGTLLNTTEGVLESIGHTVATLGCKKMPREKWTNFIGPPIMRTLIEEFGCTEDEARAGTKIFREYYAKNALLKAFPYDGIFEVCEGLKDMGIRMSVATYKREDYAVRLLEYFGFHRYFYPMHGADENDTLTKKDIVNKCMEEMGFSKKEYLLAGDTSSDAKAAEDVGISFLAVTYGFGYKTEEDVVSRTKIGVAGKPEDILSVFDRK